MADNPVEGTSDAPVIADFTLELLRELRAHRFRPAGWLGFLARAWHQSRATARDHPALVASWARATGALAGAEAVALALEAALGQGAAARRALPGAALCLALQQSDAYVHLGMNAPQRGGQIYEGLGAPNTLTLVRQATAGLLWGHLLAGRPVARPYAALALLAACATDIGDGALARGRGRTTFLGQYLDSGADFSFALALALTLGARRNVPRWLVALVLGRWSMPLFYALASYFGLVSRVPFGSTLPGKLAGVAQAATLGVALAPARVTQPFGPARRALHLVTAGLLVLAPIIQLRNALRARQ
jgi:phosphatidylglycerophosphate synthase